MSTPQKSIAYYSGDFVGALYPIPVHTPRMCPVVAHAPCILLYTVLYEAVRASGPSGPQHTAARAARVARYYALVR
jgi:hypothetical protein